MREKLATVLGRIVFNHIFLNMEIHEADTLAGTDRNHANL